MKFHWGHGIVLAALTFVLFISALVYVSMQEKVDLVTSNYYEKELVYQDHIDRERNARKLPDELTLEVQKEAGHILIRFPAGMTRQGRPAGRMTT